MDEVETIISRLNGIDPARPYFDPLAAEEALRRHARLIGFRDLGVSWAMGPKEAAGQLAGADFESSEGRKWYLTMQALQDQATIELQRDMNVWSAYRRAQGEAEERVGETLHLDPFELEPLDGIDHHAAEHSHTMAFLVRAHLRDILASAAVDNERLEDLNEIYHPFIDALLAGLGSFWTVGETLVCLPLPRLTLRDGKLVGDGSPAAVWPNGESYAWGDDGLVAVSSP